MYLLVFLYNLNLVSACQIVLSLKKTSIVECSPLQVHLVKLNLSQFKTNLEMANPNRLD